LSSDSELSYFKKHASLAFFVSGQAQQLQRHPTLDPIYRSSSFDAHGLSPCGFSGFFLGSTGSYGQAAAAGGPGGVAGENQPVICAVASQPTFGTKPSRTRRTLSTNMSRELFSRSSVLTGRSYESVSFRHQESCGRPITGASVPHHHPP